MSIRIPIGYIRNLIRTDGVTFLSLSGINSVLAGISFVTTLAIARHLGVEGFGVYAYSIALGGYCISIACCGLEVTMVRDLVQNPHKQDELVSGYCILRSSMYVVSVFGLLIMNLIVAPEDKLGLAGLTIAMTVGIKALGFDPIYDAMNHMSRHALFYCLERALYFGPFWILVFLNPANVDLTLVACLFAVSTLLGTLLQIGWLWPRINVSISSATLKIAGQLLRNNLWVWIAVLATLSFGTLSKIVLKLHSGNYEAGLYSAAWQIVLVGSLLVNQIARIGNPKLARLMGEVTDKRKRLRFVQKYFMITIFVACIVALPGLVAPEFLLSLISSEYTNAVSVLLVMSNYVIVMAVGVIVSQYLIAVHLEKTYSLMIFSSGIFGLILYWQLIPRIGGVGAALAMTISHGCAVAFGLFIMIRHIFRNESHMLEVPCT